MDTPTPQEVLALRADKSAASEVVKLRVAIISKINTMLRGEVYDNTIELPACMKVRDGTWTDGKTFAVNWTFVLPRRWCNPGFIQDIQRHYEDAGYVVKNEVISSATIGAESQMRPKTTNCMTILVPAFGG